MPTSMLGKKIGMTRVFDGEGRMVPVTVIELGPCAVLQVKTKEQHGYEALQLGFDDRVTGEQWDRIKRKFGEKKLEGNLKGIRRPEIGHYLKNAGGAAPKRFVKEVRLAEGESFAAGDRIGADALSAWKKVDVIGTSKGKGTQGTMKSWNFKSGPNTHGSKNRRSPGSIGKGGSTPGHVPRGKKMYTHLGNERCTVRNLDVVKVDPQHNLLLVRGATPGPRGGYLVVRKAVATRVVQ